MFGLSNFIITEFLLIFYSLVTNVLYSYIVTCTEKGGLSPLLFRLRENVSHIDFLCHILHDYLTFVNDAIYVYNDL